MINRETLIQSILDILRDTSVPVKLNEFSKLLMIKSDSDDYEILKDVLDDLVNKQIINKSSRRRYSINDITDLSEIKGVIRIDNETGTIATDIFDMPTITVNRKNLRTALDGDTVIVKLLATKKNKKPKGDVIQIVERSKNSFVGTIESDGNFYFLVPDEAKYYVDFLIPENKLNGARPGDKARVTLVSWDDPGKNPVVEVAEIFGKAGDPNVEFNSIMKEFELPDTFSREVLDEAAKFKVPANRKLKGRLDLRQEMIITIDPVDARDFDDALSLSTLENGNYRLGVHIADVSAYVKENTPLDIEAQQRGNSTYLVDRVVPMLPEALSNHVCSLNPDEPRFAYSVFMEISGDGHVVASEMAETLIISKRRYSYDEVQDIIDTGNGDNSELILELHKLTEMLRKVRFEEGGIEYDTTEVKFKLDDNGRPIEASLKRTTPATALVEECMLLANQAVTKTLARISSDYNVPALLPFIYRIHEVPNPKQIREVMEFISTLVPIRKKKEYSSRDINELLKKVEELPEKNVVNQILIRSMPKAVYSPFNMGHFGLGFGEYTHFTSPIRRYSDLMVHRLLKEYHAGKPESERIKTLSFLVKGVSRVCSERERLSMEAERASAKLAHAMMAEELVGKEFGGTITGVTSFGIFIQMDEFYGEGLLHIRDLKDDYYYFDESKFRLVGKSTKKAYGFGDRIRVKIVKVNIKKRNIDLVMAKNQFSDAEN